MAHHPKKQFVDLTHTFAPGIPHWPRFPDEERELLFWHDTNPPGPGTLGTGFYAQLFTHVGQWGTHVDPPAHFIRGLRTVGQIDVKEMVMPLVVLDVHNKVAMNPDYTITMDDVRSWEKKYGKIPKSVFVAMRTDWSKRWPDMAAMQNKDANGIAHYPGWSMEVVFAIHPYGKRCSTDSAWLCDRSGNFLLRFISHYELERSVYLTR